MSSRSNETRQRDILIVVVDDRSGNLGMLSELLSGEGYRVRAVTSGERALETARLAPPDCVLLEIATPATDGIETCNAFRADPRLERAPIIFLTAFDDAGHKVRALEAGACDYISKPFQVEEVLARVNSQMRLGHCERELRRTTAELVEAKAQLDEIQRSKELQKESRFRAMIEKSEEVIALTARDGTVLYMSPAGKRMMGFDPMTTARKVADLWHPDDAPLILERRAWLLEHPGESATGEFRVLGAAGDWRWIELVSTNLLDDPAVGALINNFRDVTERRRTVDELRVNEAQLRQAQKWLQRAHESAAIGTYQIDLGSRTIHLSADAAHLLRAGHDAVAMPLDEYRKRFYYPEDLVESAKKADATYADGGTLRLESRVARGDGNGIWIRTSASVERGDGGERIVVGVIQDITEQRRALDELRASEARFRALTHSGVAGIAFSTTAGTIFEANDTFLTMIGYSREDLTTGAISWVTMTPPDFAHTNVRAFDELRARGFATPWEKEYIRKDGTRVPCLVGVSAIDASHNIVFAIDLTERKRVEAALQRSEGQLRQAQKMEAVGRLAGGVAHDFNNVLSVILSYASLIPDALAPNDPIREDVAEIAAAGQRAAELTRQLLLFSRQQVVETKVIDLNGVLAGMSKMIRRILGEDVEVVSTVVTSPWKFRCDPGSIEQVVMNLIVNARDAMPQGGTLTLETANATIDEAYARAHHGAAPGRYVMLAVSDTGIGMDQATQARIFDPFFTTKGVGKGTGLGLSTVFGIVQQSGGTVWVESEPGKGASFKVYFPRVDEQEPISVRTALLTMSPRGIETVLLVEDEDHVRAVARAILQRSGYEVLEARNGNDALLLGERHEGAIHLLVSDVVMPRMSGPELATRLAKIHPEARVLCMSGYTDDSVVRHGLVDQGFAFLQKPFTPQSLTRKVRDVLDEPGR